MTAPWIAAFVALWLLTVVVAVVVTGILKRSTVALERLDDYMTAQGRASDMTRLPIGSDIPRFDAEDLQGRRVASDELFARPAVVLFLGDEGCAPCDELIDELMRSELRTGGTQLVVVGRREIVGSLAQRFGNDTLRVFVEGAAAQFSRSFDNRISPQAFRVEPPGTLAAVEIPNTVKELEMLLAETKGGESSVVLSGD